MAAAPPPPPLPSGASGGKKKKTLTPQQAAARAAARKQAELNSPAYQQAQARAQAQATAREEKKLNSPAYIKQGVKRAVERKKYEQQALAASNVDPYVTIRNGALVPVKNPKNAIHVNGQPVTRSQALRGWQQYNDLWLSYLGRNITAGEFQHFLTNGWSQQRIITQYLVNRPNFTKSPIWKQKAGDYTDVWQQVYGPNAKPDQKVIKQAVISGMSQTAFADQLRKRPDYVTSNEFKTNSAQLSTVYQKIFGTPDARGQNIVSQATLAGWTQDQFADWLRHQPEYTQSEEFQSKALGVANALGMITGSLPTMVPGNPLANPNGGPSPLPNDKRAPTPTGGPTPTDNLNVSAGTFGAPF